VESVVDYAIYALDAAGYVLSWNPGAARLKGYTADEIIGRHFSVFFPAEDVAAGRPERELESAAHAGRYEEEGWRVRKDGTRFWANIVIVALRDAGGELLGFGKVTRDLTARRAAEEQARRLAAEMGARTEAERRSAELAHLTEQLQQQAMELEMQTEEAQSLSEELEQANADLLGALADAEGARGAAVAAEAFARGILEAIADPFVVQDREWRFRYMNQAAADILSRSRRVPAESLIGRVVWEVYPEIVGTTFEREMRRAAAERVPVTFEAYDPELGEWSQMFCYPLADGGLATQWKNISGRKQAEEAARYLARASEVLAASLDHEATLAELARLVVPDLADWCAVSLVEEDGVVRQVAVAHVDPARTELARELHRRYPPDPDAPAGVPRVIRTGEPELHREITDALLDAAARDDEHRRVLRALGLRSAIIVPIAARGRTVGALTLVSAESRRRYGDAELALAMELGRRAGTAIDNARLFRQAQAARAEAEGANRAKSDFLATMSHELRTPLNAIGGYAELLEMEIHGPLTRAQRDAVERVRRSGRHLLALINDILNFARIEAGHLALNVNEVPVRDVLAGLEPLVAPQLHAKGLGFEYELCDDGLTARTDPEKVRQILLNLLSNAIKFTPAGGRISISCDTDGERVLVRVHDTGAGIPADKLDRIFEPFVQLDRTLASTHEGAGLGLSISRDLARAMGGELTVASTVGVGSTFTLALPRGGR
jgi:PAS domain S-box-containing protein